MLRNAFIGCRQTAAGKAQGWRRRAPSAGVSSAWSDNFDAVGMELQPVDIANVFITHC